MSAGIDVLSDGDAADQGQGHHVHIAIAEGAHRQEMTQLVDHDHHQDHPGRRQIPEHRTEQHEQHDAEGKQ